MSVHASPLAHAYHQRRGTFVSDERFGDWRLKLYGLAAPEKGVRQELLDITRGLAEASLPAAVDETHHGAAFAIAHDANYPIALVYWWQAENELHQRVFVGRPDDLTDMSPVPLTPTGCVWELGVVEFERQAWIEDVIGNPAGPDLDRYMARRFNGLV
jgi:hypothetical protein